MALPTIMTPELLHTITAYAEHVFFGLITVFLIIKIYLTSTL
jgi:hypothetical protein